MATTCGLSSTTRMRGLRKENVAALSIRDASFYELPPPVRIHVPK